MRVLTTMTVNGQPVPGAGGIPVGGAMDFEGFTLPTGWLWEDGAAHSRTTYAALLAAITIEQTGTRTNGSAVITGLSSTAHLRVGCPVEGTGIPASTTILSVNSATQVTLSANATSSGSDPLTFFPHGNGDGSTTFNAPDARGRTSVGMDNIGGTDAGVLAASTVGLGHVTGTETVALTAAQTPLRTHTHSGTTGNDNVDHGHSGSTAGISANHTHTQSNFLAPNTTRLINTNSGTSYRMDWGGIGTPQTGTVSADHGHNFSTGGRSAFHQHAFTTGNPSVAEANGDAHNNMQPSRLVNRIIYAGA